jgi:hypothetical protein
MRIVSGLDRLDPLLAVLGFHNFVSGLLQSQPNRFSDVRFVVHNQYASQ